MVDNSKLNSQKGPLSLEEWKRQNVASLTSLSNDQILEKYQIYKQSFNGGTQTTPQFDDNTDKTQITEIQKAQSANNVDLVGATNALTSVGIATGNESITKAGVLGNTAVRAIKQIQVLKNLKGADKAVGISNVAGSVADVADQALFGDQFVNNSDLTNKLNTGYDAASSAIMTMGPYGAIIGGAMKVGGLLSDGLTALGVGTDQMTTTDKILDSKFLKLSPVGLINSIGASTSNKFSIDNSIREQIGGSYDGAYAFMDNAASRAGKKYGLFSSGAKNSANRDIASSKVMQGQIGRINKNARDRESIVSSNNQLLSTNYQFNLIGGYDQRYMRAAKEGGKIERIKKINLTFRKGGQIHQTVNLETKEVEWQPVIIHRVEELKQGGSIGWIYDDWEPEIKDDWEPIIIESTNQLKNGGELKHTPDIFQKKEEINKKSRSLLELIEYSKKVNPRFIQRLSEPFKYVEWVDDNGEKQFGTHELGYAEIDGKYVIFPNIQERDDKQLFRYTDFRQALDNALKNKNVLWVNSEDEAKLFTESKELENGKFSGYKSGWSDYFKQKPKFYNGGKTEESKKESLSNQQNVIPEGALHARKHHMENTEGLTQKGIPVIDNKGEQQAEIELNEIIFNLEVTKKLEELYKDGSDEAAIEAGKLLVQEILFNTEDRTGLIKTLKQGGTINGSTE